MSLNVDKRGNIFIYQGDSGSVVISGLPTNKNYRVYFTVKDLKNKPVVEPLNVQSNYSSSVIFLITSEFSEKLRVPNGEELAFYHYGLKTVDEDGDENTLFVEGCSYGENNNIIVFPSKVEV